MPVDEPTAEYDVTCATDGCVNTGIVIRVIATATDPMIICGPCGQQITDITPAE